MKTYKQWELPNGAEVDTGDETIIFKQMDGIYAQWIIDGEVGVFNFDKFEKVGDNKYKVIK